MLNYLNVVDDEFLPAHNRLKYQLSILKPYLHVRSCPTLLTKTVTLSALPDLPRWCHVLLYMMMMVIMDMMMMMIMIKIMMTMMMIMMMMMRTMMMTMRRRRRMMRRRRRRRIMMMMMIMMMVMIMIVRCIGAHPYNLVVIFPITTRFVN